MRYLNKLCLSFVFYTCFIEFTLAFVPTTVCGHNAALVHVDSKIYFTDGFIPNNFTNYTFSKEFTNYTFSKEFYYLDVVRPFKVDGHPLPWVDLSDVFLNNM